MDEKLKELLDLYRDRLKDWRNLQRGRRRQSIERAPEAVGQVVDALFKKNPGASQKILENRALLAWESFVGAAAAQASTALRISGYRLIVQVKDPIWKQQLSLLKRQILQRYRESFPQLKLRDIFFTG